MMLDAVDMRVVLIGAVALIIAFYEGAAGGGHSASAVSHGRASLTHCTQDASAFAGFLDAGGDITGSLPTMHSVVRRPVCR
jgi:hypothetical protein